MEQKELKIEMLERAMIPKRFWDVKYSLIPDEFEYKQKLKNYMKNLDTMLKEGVGLFLFSKDNSSGKTSCGVIILKYALKHKHTALFIRADELKDSVIEKSSFDEDETLYERALSVDILLIDDIDKEYKGKSGFVQNVVENLIRNRCQNKKITILTSNRLPNELKDLYSKDLAELLTEVMIPLKIPGESEGGINWRKLKHEQIKKLLD